MRRARSLRTPESGPKTYADRIHQTRSSVRPIHPGAPKVARGPARRQRPSLRARRLTHSSARAPPVVPETFVVVGGLENLVGVLWSRDALVAPRNRATASMEVDRVLDHGRHRRGHGISCQTRSPREPSWHRRELRTPRGRAPNPARAPSRLGSSSARISVARRNSERPALKSPRSRAPRPAAARCADTRARASAAPGRSRRARRGSGAPARGGSRRSRRPRRGRAPRASRRSARGARRASPSAATRRRRRG